MNHPPVLGNPPSAVVAPNGTVTLDLLDGASDPDGDPLTVFVASEDPTDGAIASIDLQSDKRTVQVSPRFTSASGTIHIIYRVRDNNYNYADGIATVTISRPPTAFDAKVSTDIATPCSISLQGSDPDTSSLTFAIAWPPAFGTLTGTPPNLTYTPLPWYDGTDSFTFTASDGLSTATGTVFISVVRPNHPPTTTPQAVTTSQNTTALITLGANDPDGDKLTFSWTAPAHGSLFPDGIGRVLYTPDTGYLGPDSFTFTVSDGPTFSAPATVSIDVVFVNHAPVAFSDFFSLAEDSSQQIRLSAGDQDGDALTYTIESKPKHGALTGTPPNLMYTPDANFNGTDTVTFDVSDGTATSQLATITLSITSVDDAPTASNGAVTTAEDTSVPITLIASDIDDTSLFFSITSPPSDGTLTGSGANWTYTPALNATGTRSFTFRASDGSLSAIATVTITITPVNDRPQASDDFAATDAGEALSINALGNDVDVDGDPLKLLSVTRPAHGHADIVAGQLVYTPDAEFAGIDTFDYAAADPAGLSSTAHVIVGVGAGQFPTGAPAETIAALGVSSNSRNAPSLSGDGRYIAFTSALPIATDDTNDVPDVYVYDRGTRTFSRVSESSTGDQANGMSRGAQISADGRYVAFESVASNLVPGDTNKAFDVFRHDRVTGETVRVSVSSGGSQGTGASFDARISDDGNTIAFTSSAFDLVESDANGAPDIFVRDMTSGTTTRVSVSAIGGDADLAASEPAISGNGRFVAFASAATNLVPGDSNGLADIFVRDLVARTTSRVSVSSNNVEANRASSGASLSRDGRFVSFLSSATNLVTGASGTQVYVRDTRDVTTIRPLTESSATWARLSPDGRYLAVVGFAGVILCDRIAPATVTPAAAWAWPSFSGNGRYVAVFGTPGNGSLIVTPNPL